MTEDELFEALKDAIEQEQLNERLEKEPIEKAFELYCQPFEKIFDDATKEQQDAAKEQLQPAKVALDDKINTITRAASRKIDALVKKYVAYQKTIEKQFYADQKVKEALSEKEASISNEKEKVQKTLNEISERTDDAIRLLKEKYEVEAKALEAK